MPDRATIIAGQRVDAGVHRGSVPELHRGEHAMVTLPLECIQARPVREKVPGAEDEPLDGATGRVEDDAGVAHRRTPATLAPGTGEGRRFPASRHLTTAVTSPLHGGQRSQNA